MRILLAVVVIAALLRIPGLFTDFWLDEVWSLLLSQEVDSALEILTGIRHDNNHPLNTLVLYALGDRDAWWLYRLHAYLAGLVLVALAWLAARDSGRLDARLAAVLTATSYLLIHFSSEARGYTLSICFGFAAWTAAQRFAGDPRWSRAVAIWLCVLLGFLSHLVFVHAFVGIGFWLGFQLMRSRESVSDALASYVLGFGVPVFIGFGVVIFLVQGMMIGGGPDYRLGGVLLTTASYAVGGPGSGPLATTAALLYACACIGSIFWMQRAGRSEWILFASVIFLSPALLLAANPPPVLFPRYFLMSVAFSYLAFAHALAGIYRRFASGRWLTLALVVAFAAASAAHLLALPGAGRGSYREAVLHMVQRTPGATVTVESDDDVGTKMLLAYYQRFLPEGKAMRYSDRDDRPAGAPLWRIHRRFGAIAAVEAAVGGDHGGHYELERIFPYTSGLSGTHWILYRRVGSP